MKNLVAKIITVILLAITPITSFSMTPTEEASRLVSDINIVRKGYQLTQLSVDAELSDVAAVRIEEVSNNFSHIRPNGASYQTVIGGRSFGENIAQGFTDADDTFSSWMKSSEDKENILNADFRRVSVKAYIDDNGNWYWAAEFGF